jgi:hypothetical protein
MIFVTRRGSDHAWHAFVDSKATKLISMCDKHRTRNQDEVCFMRSSSSGDGSLRSSGCNTVCLVGRCDGGLSGLIFDIGWWVCGGCRGSELCPALVSTVKDTRSVRLDKLTTMTPLHGRSVFLVEALPFCASFLCWP